MKSKSSKKKKSKDISKETEDEIMVQHLEEEIKRYTNLINWNEEQIMSYKVRIAQNRKILKKLKE